MASIRTVQSTQSKIGARRTLVSSVTIFDQFIGVGNDDVNTTIIQASPGVVSTLESTFLQVSPIGIVRYQVILTIRDEASDQIISEVDFVSGDTTPTDIDLTGWQVTSQGSAPFGVISMSPRSHGLIVPDTAILRGQVIVTRSADAPSFGGTIRTSWIETPINSLETRA